MARERLEETPTSVTFPPNEQFHRLTKTLPSAISPPALAQHRGANPARQPKTVG